MLKYPEIDPVIVSIGPMSIHWYGMMYLFGLVAAYFVARHNCKQPWSPVQPKHLEDLLFYGALGIIIGGRLGSALFYNFEMFLSDPLWLFRVWEGGMAFHGGLLGVGAACWFMARKTGCSLGQMFDFVAPMAPIGLGFGRIGNFIGQELWGRPTDGPWAMIFPKDPEQIPRHASQLYEAFLEGLVLFIIVYWFSRKQRPAYAVTGVFLIGYGCFRFLVEFARTPDAHIGFDLMGWMTRGQILSVPMVIGGIVCLLYAYRQQASSKA